MEFSDISMTESFGFKQSSYHLSQKSVSPKKKNRYKCYECAGDAYKSSKCGTCRGLKQINQNNVMVQLLAQIMSTKFSKDRLKNFPKLQYEVGQKKIQNNYNKSNVEISRNNRGSIKNEKKNNNTKIFNKQYLSQGNSLQDSNSNSIDNSFDSLDSSKNTNESIKSKQKLQKNKSKQNNLYVGNYNHPHFKQQFSQIKQQSCAAEQHIVICDACKKQGELGTDYMQCRVCNHFYICLKCYQQKMQNNKRHKQKQQKASKQKNKVEIQKNGKTINSIQSKQEPLNPNIKIKQVASTNENIINYFPLLSYEQKPKMKSSKSYQQMQGQDSSDNYYQIHQHPLTRYYYRNQQQQHQLRQQEKQRNYNSNQQQIQETYGNIANKNKKQGIKKLVQSITQSMSNYTQSKFKNIFKTYDGPSTNINKNANLGNSTNLLTIPYTNIQIINQQKQSPSPSQKSVQDSPEHYGHPQNDNFNKNKSRCQNQNESADGLAKQKMINKRSGSSEFDKNISMTISKKISSPDGSNDKNVNNNSGSSNNYVSQNNSSRTQNQQNNSSKMQKKSSLKIRLFNNNSDEVKKSQYQEPQKFIKQCQSSQRQLQTRKNQSSQQQKQGDGLITNSKQSNNLLKQTRINRDVSQWSQYSKVNIQEDQSELQTGRNKKREDGRSFGDNQASIMGYEQQTQSVILNSNKDGVSIKSNKQADCNDNFFEDLDKLKQQKQKSYTQKKPYKFISIRHNPTYNANRDKQDIFNEKKNQSQKIIGQYQTQNKVDDQNVQNNSVPVPSNLFYSIQSLDVAKMQKILKNQGPYCEIISQTQEQMKIQRQIKKQIQDQVQATIQKIRNKYNASKGDIISVDMGVNQQYVVNTYGNMQLSEEKQLKQQCQIQPHMSNTDGNVFRNIWKVYQKRSQQEQRSKQYQPADKEKGADDKLQQSQIIFTPLNWQVQQNSSTQNFSYNQTAIQICQIKLNVDGSLGRSQQADQEELSLEQITMNAYSDSRQTHKTSNYTFHRTSSYMTNQNGSQLLNFNTQPMNESKAIQSQVKAPIQAPQEQVENKQIRNRKICCQCHQPIQNRSMYVQCQTCQKYQKPSYLLCDSCFKKGAVIKAHYNSFKQINIKHEFKTSLYRQYRESSRNPLDMWDKQEMEQQQDDWRKQDNIFGIRKSKSKQTEQIIQPQVPQRNQNQKQLNKDNQQNKIKFYTDQTQNVPTKMLKSFSRIYEQTQNKNNENTCTKVNRTDGDYPGNDIYGIHPLQRDEKNMQCIKIFYKFLGNLGKIQTQNIGTSLNNDIDGQLSLSEVIRQTNNGNLCDHAQVKHPIQRQSIGQRYSSNVHMDGAWLIDPSEQQLHNSQACIPRESIQSNKGSNGNGNAYVHRNTQEDTNKNANMANTNNLQNAQNDVLSHNNNESVICVKIKDEDQFGYSASSNKNNQDNSIKHTSQFNPSLSQDQNHMSNQTQLADTKKQIITNERKIGQNRQSIQNKGLLSYNQSFINVITTSKTIQQGQDNNSNQSNQRDNDRTYGNIHIRISQNNIPEVEHSQTQEQGLNNMTNFPQSSSVALMSKSHDLKADNTKISDNSGCTGHSLNIKTFTNNYLGLPGRQSPARKSVKSYTGSPDKSEVSSRIKVDCGESDSQDYHNSNFKYNDNSLNVSETVRLMDTIQADIVQSYSNKVEEQIRRTNQRLKDSENMLGQQFAISEMQSSPEHEKGNKQIQFQTDTNLNKREKRPAQRLFQPNRKFENPSRQPQLKNINKVKTYKSNADQQEDRNRYANNGNSQKYIGKAQKIYKKRSKSRESLSRSRSQQQTSRSRSSALSQGSKSIKQQQLKQQETNQIQKDKDVKGQPLLDLLGKVEKSERLEKSQGQSGGQSNSKEKRTQIVSKMGAYNKIHYNFEEEDNKQGNIDKDIVKKQQQQYQIQVIEKLKQEEQMQQDQQQAYQFEQYQCDICSGTPIRVRYHCMLCQDYDLCANCFNRVDYFHRHGKDSFQRINKSKQMRLHQQDDIKQCNTKSQHIESLIKAYLPQVDLSQIHLNNRSQCNSMPMNRNSYVDRTGRNSSNIDMNSFNIRMSMPGLDSSQVEQNEHDMTMMHILG